MARHRGSRESFRSRSRKWSIAGNNRTTNNVRVITRAEIEMGSLPRPWRSSVVSQCAATASGKPVSSMMPVASA
ncbi:Uncharacterised protein [Mycobacterium tuberculosis]|nr:Uncharacterised protein [Mycobacterium tuberculosis]